jgi:excisionase family DNA binding protein
LSTNFPNSRDWVSQAEAARIRGVTRQAIARLIKKGRLQTLEIGGKTLILRSEIQAFKREPAGRPPNDRIARSN